MMIARSHREWEWNWNDDDHLQGSVGNSGRNHRFRDIPKPAQRRVIAIGTCIVLALILHFVAP
jgi:hypothetical protein